MVWNTLPPTVSTQETQLLTLSVVFFFFLEALAFCDSVILAFSKKTCLALITAKSWTETLVHPRVSEGRTTCGMSGLKTQHKWGFEVALFQVAGKPQGAAPETGCHTACVGTASVLSLFLHLCVWVWSHQARYQLYPQSFSCFLQLFPCWLLGLWASSCVGVVMRQLHMHGPFTGKAKAISPWIDWAP